MIKKYTYGTPFQTDTVTTQIESTKETFPFFTIKKEAGFSFTYLMGEDDIVYGLGENIRGINKRGFSYISNCSDECGYTEDKHSIYAAHNFVLVDGSDRFGLFIDCPEKITFDIGWSDYDTFVITTEGVDMDLYIIEEPTLQGIVKSFRKLIGESYIPPKWGLGYQQSRWGYASEEDFYEVAKGYESNRIPLEAIYMDIDYMERFKDFTIDREKFPHFETLVLDMKKKGIKLVPIIDAGVKIEDGYETYEEGLANDYFCTDCTGKPFVVAVWPGRVLLPDFLNPDARDWFGKKYQFLTDLGIEGFWNDMNEPALFYSDEGLKETFDFLDTLKDKNIGIYDYFALNDSIKKLSNNPKDYEKFFHKVNGEKVNHSKIHNLYGYNMTRAAAKGFDEIDKNKRFLLFSRSSCIGMHRYGGIWTGDNCSWWSHLLLNIKMMPSLNMCGFLYSGADLGGFSVNTSYDLMVRWLQFGMFTPLMRNHSALGTRDQELYQFKGVSYLRELIEFRYSLIPYLYSEYIKASKNNDMLFKPLSFVYEEDITVRTIEDQLILGESIMIAPIYTQNATGRYVYLPEDMIMMTIGREYTRSFTLLKKGHQYIEASLYEFPIFIRPNHCLALCRPSSTTESLNTKNLELLCFANGSKEITYELYDDDGYTKDIDLSTSTFITIQKNKDSWEALFSNKDYHFFDIHVL